MKLITSSKLKFKPRYPIGSDLTTLNDMLELFNIIIRNNYPVGSTINLICRGSSGAIIAGMLSQLIRDEYLVYISHIKKKDESSHSGSNVYKRDDNQINIILDDFIDSGNTINTIYDYVINKTSSFLSSTPFKIHMLLVSDYIGSNTLNIEYAKDTDIIACGSIHSEYDEVIKERAEYL